MLKALTVRYDVRATDIHAGTVAGTPVEALDITDTNAVRKAAAGCEIVAHLAIANRSTLQQAIGDDVDALDRAEVDVGIWGTRNVFIAAAEAKVKRVIFMSSLTVQMGRPLDVPVHDHTPPSPLNHYAVTKLYGEHLADLHVRRGDFTAVCLRLGQPYPVEHYGPNDIHEPGSRTLGITFPDIARGLIAAAEADLGDRRLAVAYLLSDTDEPVYHTQSMHNLGYKPGDRFTAEGVVPA